MRAFLELVIPIVELYDVDLEDDWLEQRVGSEDVDTVRLCRTVYLVSKFCERMSGRIATIKSKYPNIREKMEKQIEGM